MRGAWLRGVGLAAITGSRTALGPALVCRATPHAPRVRALAYLLAALELIGDKLPGVPNRTAPIGLGLRIICGAGVARAMLPERSGRAAAAGARALGVAAAVLGAFAGLRLRVALTRRLGGGALANAIAGGVEDAALVAAGCILAGPRPAR